MAPQSGIPSALLTRRHVLYGAAGLTFLPWAAGAADLQMIDIPGVPGLKGYLAKPQTAGRRPAILVMHDLAGLTDHIKSITRRLASEGYVALAMDCAGAAPAGLSRLAASDVVTMMRAAVALLRARPDYGGKVGVLGFGWGGTAANRLALADPALNAAVAYYGLQPLYYQEDDYRAAGAAFLHHYASRDTMNNQGIDNFRAGLRDVGKEPATHIYPGVARGFDDDTGATYNAAAAALAWTRTIAFLKKHLDGGKR